MRINQPPLFSGAVVSGFIGDAAVVSGSIGSGQIGLYHLASGVGGVASLTSGQVVSGNIGDGAVVSGSIASGQVSNFALSSGAAIANLQSGSIGSGLLANDSVVSGSLASGSVGIYKLEALTTTYTANSGLLVGQSLTYTGSGMIWQDPDHLMLIVRNNTGAPMTKGSVVYISGGLGSQALVTLAAATNDPSSSKTVGILQDDIADNDEGRCLLEGLLHNVNTNAFPVGTLLYLSTTAGQFTNVKYQTPEGHLVYVGTVIRQHATQGTIAVKIQNGYELEELHNVRILSGSVNSGHVLQYNTLSGGYWQNVYPNIGSGYLSNNSVLSGSIASGSVSNFHLSSGASTFNLLSGSVTNTQLANNAVTINGASTALGGTYTNATLTIGTGLTGGSYNGSGAVTIALGSGAAVANLLSGSIGSGLLANNSVVSGSIASGSVGNFHLSSGCVTSGDLGNASIVSGSIASGQISNFALSSGAAIFNLLSGSIGSGLLGNGSVVSGSIASGNVGKFSLTSGLVPSFTISASTPSSPLYGDRWFDTNTGTLLTYIYDGATAQWVQ